MKLNRMVLIATVGAAFMARGAFAQSSTQTVTFEVDAINQIAMTGSPSLDINAATAGNAPTSVTSSSNSWAVTTNQTGSTISASIATAMPTGVTLSVALVAPSGGTSTGTQPIGTTAVSLVTGVTKVNASGLGVTYTLAATAAAGVITSATKVVTYTITGGV